jgi:hypothetical protein
MKILFYAHTNAESMIEAGIKAGLSKDAADNFRYYEEVELEADVDKDTGEVLTCRVVLKKYIDNNKYKNLTALHHR